MYTKQQLKEQLKSAGIRPDGTLLVHVSMKSIGAVDGGADAVLDALSEYMEPGLLVIPSHTWGTVSAVQPVFDVRESKPCIGLLPDLFRKRPGVIRSLHATHSVCALGRDAAAFTAGQERFDTPCAPDSCYGTLEKRDAQVLLIGVSFARNTSVHCIEEIAKIPNRLAAEREPFLIRDYEGRLFPAPTYRHGNADSERYVKLEPVMFHRQQLRRVKFGLADSLLFRERELFATTLELLARDPDLLGDFQPVPTDWY